MTAAAIPRPNCPVLILNPRSGGGKAQQHDLVGQCRARGIEPIVFERGSDIGRLAAAAVLEGADIIGVAGGDGSLGAVAAVAAEYDVPFVCIPAGTRNHFALDAGINRSDVVGALDAFIGGTERRIDLARVNGRVFVNNVSLGLYGRIVRAPEYRDAKLRTVIEMLPELLGPRAAPFDLRFTGPDGAEYPTAQLVLVSNNRYEIDPVGDTGTRSGMNQGMLGVVVARRPPPFPRLVLEWSTPKLRIDSGSPIDAGIDGEAVTVEPPLVLESLPSALRLRIPVHRHAGTPPLRRPLE